eukprot:1145251-Pelagomonas_calceolata.AAC.8
MEGQPLTTTGTVAPRWHQLQYHTFFAPMIIEKWALPLFMKAGLQPASTSTAARTGVKCACCKICKKEKKLATTTGGHELTNFESPYLGMYICDICQRTYTGNA